MIRVHADDFGINIKQSYRIMECNRLGCLNSISIMANSPNLNETIAALDSKMTCCIHLNFGEGYCCSNPIKIPLLVDEFGRFELSFAQLLIKSLFQKKLREQIKYESMAQIKNVIRFWPDTKKIRIDSHIHYHMIPTVFRGIFDACDELKMDIEYIRWPVEPFWPFLKHPTVWKSVPLENVAKTIVLHFLGLINGPELKHRDLQEKTEIFFGILLSGKMFYSEVNFLWKDYLKIAKRKKKKLEILFHPGGIYEKELYLDSENKGCMSFYYSTNRQREAETIYHLKEGKICEYLL